MEKRQCDPRFVVNVWKKIVNLQLKNKPTLWSTLRAKKSENETDDSFDLKIDKAIGDGLIQIEVKDGEQHLTIPSRITASLHDWYCYRCHNPGLLKDCDTCWRSYHLDCFNQRSGDLTFNCPQCNKNKAIKPMSTNRSLNHLLAGILIRLRQQTSILYNLTSSSDLATHFHLIFKQPMDLDTIQSKVERDVYTCHERLNEDLRILQHNVMLAFGDTSEEAQLMKLIFTDFHTEISRLKECEDCYFVSYCRFGSWFCYPCDPEHEIVYAKVRGFNFWPAKVISISSNRDYDVRFFGGNHERAIVQGSSIRPITANRDQLLGSKRTEALKEACRELDEYLQLKRLGTKIETPSDHLLKLLREQNEEISPSKSTTSIHSRNGKKKKEGASTTSTNSSLSNETKEPAIAKIRISLSKTKLESVVVLTPLKLANGNHDETSDNGDKKNNGIGSDSNSDMLSDGLMEDRMKDIGSKKKRLTGKNRVVKRLKLSDRNVDKCSDSESIRASRSKANVNGNSNVTGGNLPQQRVYINDEDDEDRMSEESEEEIANDYRGRAKNQRKSDGASIKKKN